VTLTRNRKSKPWGFTTEPIKIRGADWAFEVVQIQEGSPAWKSDLMLLDIIYESRSDDKTGQSIIRDALTGPAHKLRLTVKKPKSDINTIGEPYPVKDRDAVNECWICGLKFDSIEEHQAHLDSEDHKTQADACFRTLVQDFGKDIAESTIVVLSGKSIRGNGIIAFDKPSNGFGCYLCDMVFNTRQAMLDHFLDERGVHQINRAVKRQEGKPYWTKFISPTINGKPRFYYELISQNYYTQAADEFDDIRDQRENRYDEEETWKPLEKVPDWVEEKFPEHMDLSRARVDPFGRQCVANLSC